MPASRGGTCRRLCAPSADDNYTTSETPVKVLAIADTLSHLGFNIQFLGSEKYVLNKIQTPKSEDVT